MPKQDKDINSSKEIQDKQDNKNHKWSVWTQGPNDAKETTRKFKQTTPGQVRDYKHFVNKRRFQKFEQLESAQHDEEAPVNSVAGGGVDMAPNAKGTKVFMKKYRVDGRTKEYREANRRIKERQEKILQKQVQAKLDMFGVHANPFAEETENKKYLETKPGSIEDAVLNALNPNADKETLTLPKKNEEEVEEGFGKLKDASKNLDKMRRAAGVKVDKQTTTKLPSGGTLRKTTYKKADEEVEIDELSNKTMSSYAQKASASQSDAEKKQDYKTADKRIAGKLRATRRKFSNDTNRILVGLKKESKDLERAMNEDGHTDVASAIRQCKTIMEDTTQMMSKLQSMNPEDALPSWWTNKLAVASNTMNNLRDYFLFPTSESVSKETENGERDAGSDEYTNYTKEMTPGQGITNPDAKKADVRKKKEQAAQQQQLNVDENMKYLNTKPGSIEEAILNALMPEAFTTKHEKGDKHTEVPEKKAGETDKDHKDRQAGRVSFKQHRRSLDKVDPDELQGKHADRKDKDIDNDGDVDSSDQYLHRRRQAIASRRKKEDAKEEVETEAFANPPKGMKFPTKGVKNMGGPKPRQLKDPKKEKMVGTKTGTKVVNKNDPRYKNSPEHESVESPWIRAAVAYLDKTVDEKTMMGVKVKKLGTQKDSETADVRKAQSGDKDALVRQQARQKFGYKKEDAVDEKTMMGVKVKKLGTQKDSETADVKKAQSGDKDALVRQQKRQKFGYKTS